MPAEMKAQLIKGVLWIHHGGRTFSVDTSAGAKARKKSGGTSSNQIAAPMPGKITKLLVKEGDPVKPGQALVMMEAMKMEYTLKAETTGNVDSVACQVGDQVILGKILVKIRV
jgi:biotin carboxyl carrier protein